MTITILEESIWESLIGHWLKSLHLWPRIGIYLFEQWVWCWCSDVIPNIFVEDFIFIKDCFKSSYFEWFMNFWSIPDWFYSQKLRTIEFIVTVINIAVKHMGCNDIVSIGIEYRLFMLCIPRFDQFSGFSFLSSDAIGWGEVHANFLVWREFAKSLKKQDVNSRLKHHGIWVLSLHR